MNTEERHHRQIDDVPMLIIENDETFDNDPERDKHLARRRIVRERVMQAIYAHLMNGRDTDELYLEIVKPDPYLNEQSLEFARSLLRAYGQNKDNIDSMIEKHLAHWKISRVALIDKILLQMGTIEFLFFPEIPPKATINELIEIAKDYSTDESSKFVNGILHAIKEDLQKEGKLNKEGRGLIDQSFS